MLTAVDLGQNNIGNQGAQYLANALHQNEVTRLTSMYFLVNYSFMIFLQALVKLNLSSNEIGPQGAEYLANALKQNMVV